MKEIPLPDGVKPLDIFVGSIAKEKQTEAIPGRNGIVDYGTNYTERSVDLSMWIVSGDTIDYRLLRNELYALFDTGNAFYIAESNVPSRVLKVAVDESYIPERITRTHASVEISCRTLDSVFWESIYTTKELNDTGYDAIVAKYGLVDGIDQDHTKYEFNAPVAVDDLTDESYKNGHLSTGTGAESSHSDYLISSGSIGVSPNRGYVFEDTMAHPDIRYWNIYEFDNSGNFIKFSTTLGGDGNNHTVRFYNEGRYIRLMAINAEGVSLNASDIGTKMNPLVRVDHRVNKFSVWNAGNVAIEPEFMDLKIRLNYTYSADGVTIKNLTTGETFELDVKLNGSHVVLDGISVMYGNINGLRKSNRKFIRLAPGLNEFEITADMYEEAIIDFKYCYK